MKQGYDELADFLQSYFNQDMESIEKAWDTFIRENETRYKSELKRLIMQFIEDTAFTKEEKADFLSNHTDIYFPNIPLPPVEWLQNLAKRLDWVQELPGVYIREYSEAWREVVVIQSIDGTECQGEYGLIPTTPLEWCSNQDEYLELEQKVRSAYPAVSSDTLNALRHNNWGYLNYVTFGDVSEVFHKLEQVGYDDLPSLSILFVPPSQEWVVRNGLSDDPANQKVFVRKSNEQTYEAVRAVTFKDGSSSVYYRIDEYSEVEKKQAEGLEMLYEHGMFPTDDLAIEAYEFSTHGASGMDRCHHDLMTDGEIQSILQNEYGIQLSWK